MVRALSCYAVRLTESIFRRSGFKPVGAVYKGNSGVPGILSDS
jgi:hypothetical protein